MSVPIDRIAFNQATTRTSWGFRESVENCARRGVRRVGVWRDLVDDVGLAEAERILKDNGVSVTGYNRIGPLAPADTATGPADDARAAIEAAARLNAECVLVFIGDFRRFSPDLGEARRRIADTILSLEEIALDSAVRLALEPLHPMLAADRSCLNLLSQANDLCDRSRGGLGIVVDVYHVWWDPASDDEIRRAGADRLLGFHVSDWRVPTRDLVFDRAMMGDGVIDLRHLLQTIDGAGYRGAVEVEIFSELDWWRRDPSEVLEVSIERCRTVM